MLWPLNMCVEGGENLFSKYLFLFMIPSLEFPHQVPIFCVKWFAYWWCVGLELEFKNFRV